jgi:hypothetical protein
MTERKPPDVSFSSWVDQQIAEAAARGAFDNLPGAGQPLPVRDDSDDGQSWLREYVRREGVPVEDMLPTPLKLRREVERLPERVQALHREQDVRDAVTELNQRIMEWRRIPLGPPIFVRLADEELIVSTWLAGRPALDSAPAEPSSAGAAGPARRRWWRRISRRPPG